MLSLARARSSCSSAPRRWPPAASRCPGPCSSCTSSSPLLSAVAAAWLVRLGPVGAGPRRPRTRRRPTCCCAPRTAPSSPAGPASAPPTWPSSASPVRSGGGCRAPCSPACPWRSSPALWPVDDASAAGTRSAVGVDVPRRCCSTSRPGCSARCGGAAARGCARRRGSSRRPSRTPRSAWRCSTRTLRCCRPTPRWASCSAPRPTGCRARPGRAGPSRRTGRCCDGCPGRAVRRGARHPRSRSASWARTGRTAGGWSPRRCSRARPACRRASSCRSRTSPSGGPRRSGCRTRRSTTR